ncbi:hypothetical protein [Lactococcus lactis]|uniref:hypothetical protein n=1 Tax=Lactococcus lactis TaxID=1358 RepID=UPI0022E1B232|nr:hypothetical protein [Lactococcus lactis]
MEMKGAAMSELIKCPICHKMAGIRYSENRVYQSRCQNIKCRETVTVTASSEAAAEELFSKFEKGTNHPQLTIPKSIADILDKVFDDYKDLQNNAGSLTTRTIFAHYYLEDPYYKWSRRENDSYNISVLYFASKALGVDLVKVVEG